MAIVHPTASLAFYFPNSKKRLTFASFSRIRSALLQAH